MELSITLIIIILTVLVSLGGFNNRKIIDDLIFYPPAISRQNQWYRFFTNGFIHADYGHLIFNMISLYFLGRFVEQGLEMLFSGSGKWLYVVLYVTALAASLLPTYAKHKNDPYYRSLGASGAVSAVIFAGLMLVPTVELFIFLIPIPIPGFVFGPLYLLISFYMDRKGGGGINHSAHLWGALYGLLFIIVAAYAIGYPIIQSAIEQITAYIG